MINTMPIKGMKVLSIDDNKNNLFMIEAFSRKLGLEIESFQNPKEVFESFDSEEFDIVIVDYMMPDMDGIKFIKEFRKISSDIPIIMVTSAGKDEELQLNALESGATDFLSKPLNGAIFEARVANLLKLRKSIKLLSDKADLLSYEVKKATNMIVERERETLEKLGKVAEFKDPETNQHVIRVANYSKIIAEAYGLNEKMQDLIFNAAPLHDIGKIGISDEILLKPGKLSPDEWEIMKTHSQKGYELLKNSHSEYLKVGSVIAYSHHEKYDGTGYPNGFSGEMIPLYGRILAIADVFDALCSKRPYKQPWNFDDAFNYILKESGTHFDPECVRCFLESESKIRKIFETYREDLE